MLDNSSFMPHSNLQSNHFMNDKKTLFYQILYAFILKMSENINETTRHLKFR